MLEIQKTKRPYVNLESENAIESMVEALNASLHRFIGEGVIGVMMDGGLSRGYGDYLSEIDVVVFLDKEHFQMYQNGICPFPLGIAMIEGYLYDVKILDYEEECQKEYDSVGLWDLSYAKILYDPQEKMAAFMEEKLKAPVAVADASGFLWEAWWLYKLAGDIWIHRGDILQGHYIFNLAIRPLLSSLFLVNEEYIPHDKWLIHMSRSLPWKPENWDELLLGAISTGDNSLQSLKNRQKCIDEIWNAIDQKLCQDEGFHTRLTYNQKGAYDNLLRLTSRDEYTLEEWEELTGLGALNYDPIRAIFYKDGNKVVFDKDRLINLRPKDMYSWMYQIADAVREVYR